jgi:hypothetical protein
MDEETVEKPDGHLCLMPCPRCREAKYKSGACHLALGHTGSHECNAVSGDMHKWR